jgi:hypothetical protein
MTRRIAPLALGLALAAGGCATPSHVDDHFGESQRTLKAQMIANPDAGKDERPVAGLGASEAGQVIVNRQERSTVEYQDRSTTPPTSILAIEDGN